MSKLRDSLLSGLVGAITLNVVHESARRLLPHPPRVDMIGERWVVRMFRLAGRRPPTGLALYWTALGGDLLANTLHYATIAHSRSPSKIYRRGLLIGLLGGASALLLPKMLGLDTQPNQKAPITHLLTLLWYAIGGLATAGVYRSLRDKSR